MHNLKIRKVAPFCGLSGLGLELGPWLDIERRKRTWGVLGGICRISHLVGAGSAERAHVAKALVVNTIVYCQRFRKFPEQFSEK